MIQIIFEYVPNKNYFSRKYNREMIRVLYETNTLTSNTIENLTEELDLYNKILYSLSGKSILFLLERKFNFTREQILDYLSKIRVSKKDIESIEEFKERIREYGFYFSEVELLESVISADNYRFLELLLTEEFVKDEKETLKQIILKHKDEVSTIGLTLLKYKFDFFQGDYSLVPVFTMNFFKSNNLVTPEQSQEIVLHFAKSK